MAKDMRSWISQLEKAGELSRNTDEVRSEVIGWLLAESKEKTLLLENVATNLLLKV